MVVPCQPIRKPQKARPAFLVFLLSLFAPNKKPKRSLAADNEAVTAMVVGAVVSVVGLLLTIIVAIIGLGIVGDNSDEVVQNVGDINNAITNTSFNDTTIDASKTSFTAIFALLGLLFLITLVASVIAIRMT